MSASLLFLALQFGFMLIHELPKARIIPGCASRPLPLLSGRLQVPQPLVSDSSPLPHGLSLRPRHADLASCLSGKEVKGSGLLQSNCRHAGSFPRSLSIWTVRSVVCALPRPLAWQTTLGVLEYVALQAVLEPAEPTSCSPLGSRQATKSGWIMVLTPGLFARQRLARRFLIRPATFVIGRGEIQLLRPRGRPVPALRPHAVPANGLRSVLCCACE